MSKSYSIVGMNFTKSEEFLKTLAQNTPAVLLREPTNAYDPNAIAVWIEGRRVGYIPKKQNVALAQFIDQAGSGYNAEVLLAMDQKDPVAARAIDARFFRSPNSSYPMIEVVD